MARSRRYNSEMFNEYDPIFDNEKATSPVYEETTVPEPKNGIVVNTSCVNLRSIPSKSGTVLTILDNGDLVQVLEYLNDFYKIRFHDLVGYIPSKFCKEVD